MVKIYQLITQIATTPATVLITGESGTGKELVARAIHRRSDRSAQPFVAVNVAAIPDTLVESELFGHEKGAFTGAHARRLGKFELAHGGTLFLDEIGSLRLDLQAKLLRALQEREIERLGGSRPIAVDVRVLAATNVDLRQAVRDRAFREDLYYRLNVVPLHLPPLRERREDIPRLVEHFIRTLRARVPPRRAGRVGRRARRAHALRVARQRARAGERHLPRGGAGPRAGRAAARRPAGRGDAGDGLAPRPGRAAAARGVRSVRAPVRAADARARALERQPGGARARRPPQHGAGQARGLGHSSPGRDRKARARPSERVRGRGPDGAGRTRADPPLPRRTAMRDWLR